MLRDPCRLTRRWAKNKPRKEYQWKNEHLDTDILFSVHGITRGFSRRRSGVKREHKKRRETWASGQTSLFLYPPPLPCITRIKFCILYQGLSLFLAYFINEAVRTFYISLLQDKFFLFLAFWLRHGSTLLRGFFFFLSKSKNERHPRSRGSSTKFF